MKTERFDYIDLLRAFSIIGVMIIHTLSFHLNNATSLFFWNNLQFVVAAFVFCSGFVHAHYHTKLNTPKDFLTWYKKRAIRILLPFYIYFVIHFILFLIFPTIFTHFGMHKNLSFFIGSILLYGGINTNWLPLLFLELTVLTPFLFLLYRKSLLKWYIGISLLFLSVHIVYLFPYSTYKILMWIPWSLVFLIGLFSFSFSQKAYTKILTAIGIFGGVLFIALFNMWTYLHRYVNFTDNKYPPNFYYLSFAIAGTVLFFFLSRMFARKIPQWTYMYISKKSYALFFVHFIFLDVLVTFAKTYTFLSIPVVLILVIFGSIGSLILWDAITKKFIHSSTAYTTSRVE